MVLGTTRLPLLAAPRVPACPHGHDGPRSSRCPCACCSPRLNRCPCGPLLSGPLRWCFRADLSRWPLRAPSGAAVCGCLRRALCSTVLLAHRPAPSRPTGLRPPFLRPPILGPTGSFRRPLSPTCSCTTWCRPPRSPSPVPRSPRCSCACRSALLDRRACSPSRCARHRAGVSSSPSSPSPVRPVLHGASVTFTTCSPLGLPAAPLSFVLAHLVLRHPPVRHPLGLSLSPYHPGAAHLRSPSPVPRSPRRSCACCSPCPRHVPAAPSRARHHAGVRRRLPGPPGGRGPHRNFVPRPVRAGSSSTTDLCRPPSGPAPPTCACRLCCVAPPTGLRAPHRSPITGCQPPAPPTCSPQIPLLRSC